MEAGSAYFDGAVNVYSLTWHQAWESAYHFFLRCALWVPDYRAFVAIRPPENEVIGFAFGNRSEAGQWWYDKIAEHVGADHPALQNVFSLTELAVLEAYHGMGVGTSLHNILVDSAPCPRMLLSTGVSNQRARQFYERRGWYYVHMGFVFAAGQEPYLIMGKEREKPPSP